MAICTQCFQEHHKGIMQSGTAYIKYTATAHTSAKQKNQFIIMRLQREREECLTSEDISIL